MSNHTLARQHQEISQIFTTTVDQGWWTRVRSRSVLPIPGQLCLVEQDSSLTAEKYLYSPFLWPGFPQLKCSLVSLTRHLVYCPTAPGLRGSRFQTPHTPVLLRETRLFPGEHDPSSSVLLTASQTLRRPTVPRRPFFCFSTDGPTALARLIYGTSPEDAVQISCTAVSMPRTRNLWELVGPPAVLSSCKSVQAHNNRVVSDDRIFHVCFHPLQQLGRRLVELSKVPSNSETSLRPGHAADSTVQVTVSTEHLESPNLFHTDTSWTCSHHLLGDLSSSTTCSSFRNQRFLRLSPKQVTVFPWTNTGSAAMWDEVNTSDFLEPSCTR